MNTSQQQIQDIYTNIKNEGNEIYFTYLTSKLILHQQTNRLQLLYKTTDLFNNYNYNKNKTPINTLYPSVELIQEIKHYIDMPNKIVELQPILKNAYKNKDDIDAIIKSINNVIIIKLIKESFTQENVLQKIKSFKYKGDHYDFEENLTLIDNNNFVFNRIISNLPNNINNIIVELNNIGIDTIGTLSDEQYDNAFSFFKEFRDYTLTTK